MGIKDNQNLKNIQLPYEKCMENGASSLTDVELLAVLLRCGTPGMNVLDLSERVISSFSSEKKLCPLAHASFEELISISGIGKVKAVQIQCIFELARRITMEPVRRTVSLDNPDIVAGMYMQEMRLFEEEHVYLLLLDIKNCIIKKITLSTGSIMSSILEPREVFLHALRHNATGIMLIHNHPSGDPTPSRQDISITNKINEAGRLIGISLIDHIVIGDNKFVSMRQLNAF